MADKQNKIVEEVAEPDLYETPEDFEQSVEESLATKAKLASKKYSRDNQKNNSNYTHKAATRVHRRNRRIVLISVISVFVLFLGVGAAFAYSLMNTSFDDNDIDTREVLKTDEYNEPFYMVLVGTDTREEQGSYQLTDGRSDSCILVRIDPIKNIGTMISIPRDTMIKYNGTTEKFNAAYNQGGIKDTILVINEMFGIQVSHYAEVSFNGLTDMVDAVGGVEVNVPETISDEKVDAPVPAGVQTLNGVQALSFARSRNFADGDFTRSADQRVLIDALVQKAFKMPISDLPNALQVAKKFVKTDFTVMQMYSLAQQFRKADNVTLYSAMVPSTTGGINGASYCFTDQEALGRMVKMIENGEDPLMLQIVNDAKICSSRDEKDLEAKRTQYYIDHPNSPGKATEKSGTIDYYGVPACSVNTNTRTGSKSDSSDYSSSSNSSSKNSSSDSSYSSSSSSNSSSSKSEY